MNSYEDTEEEFIETDLTSYFLDNIGEQLTTVYFQYEKSNMHYHKEYVYNLRSLVRELKQETDGGYFSLEYILEKAQKILDCAKEIKSGHH
jgi:hypothetical protein